MLSVVEPNLYFVFLTPRSRKKEPSAIAFETAAAARISADAHTVRYCCRPWWAMTAGTRNAVIRMSRIDKLKRATREILRLSGIADLMTIGIGKTIRRTSVTMSETPIVISCA